MSHTTIKAPIDGSLVKLAALKGQYVSSGTSLFTIVNPERIWVVANISEKKIGVIQPGNEVNVAVDAYPDAVFKGQVEEISGATKSTFSILSTDNTAGNYTKVVQWLPVKISVIQQDDKLKPGMSVAVTIKTK